MYPNVFFSALHEYNFNKFQRHAQELIILSTMTLGRLLYLFQSKFDSHSGRLIIVISKISSKLPLRNFLNIVTRILIDDRIRDKMLMLKFHEHESKASENLTSHKKNM